MSDLIDRQAAIEALSKLMVPYGDGSFPGDNEKMAYDATIVDAIHEIQNLPSAQPEPCKDVVIRNAIIQKLNTMDRYVSEELRLCDTDKKFPKNEVFIVDDVYEEMSTIEPRKKGKWIIKDNPETGWYRITCSECGEDVTSTAPCIGFYPNAKVMWDFCPNCGADMREVEE